MTPEAWIARWHGMDDAAIQESLDRLMAGKTVIAVAHRLSTLERMDRLVVLDHGRVAEQGSHAQPLARAAFMPGCGSVGRAGSSGIRPILAAMRQGSP
jgi:energy-coupling factor transporter ATP-binding protein EcfA2